MFVNKILQSTCKTITLVFLRFHHISQCFSWITILYCIVFVVQHQLIRPWGPGTSPHISVQAWGVGRAHTSVHTEPHICAYRAVYPCIPNRISVHSERISVRTEPHIGVGPSPRIRTHRAAYPCVPSRASDRAVHGRWGRAACPPRAACRAARVIDCRAPYTQEPVNQPPSAGVHVLPSDVF